MPRKCGSATPVLLAPLRAATARLTEPAQSPLRAISWAGRWSAEEIKAIACARRSSEEVSTRLVAMAQAYTAKADAIEPRARWCPPMRPPKAPRWISDFCLGRLLKSPPPMLDAMGVVAPESESPGANAPEGSGN